MQSSWVKLYIAIGTLSIFSFDSKSVTLKDSPLYQQFSAGILDNCNYVSVVTGFNNEQEFDKPGSEDGRRKISLVKAGLYSALLPGLGEYYVGHRSKARIFFAAEAATWIGFFTYHFYGNWKEDDLIDYAAVYAHADLEGKSDEFQDWVGFYEDIDQFNSLGRVQDPERPFLIDNAENHWRWQTAAEQETYRNLKNKSRDAYRRRDFMIGLAIANRVVSILDAVRDAKRSKREIKDSEFSIVNSINYRLAIDPFSQERLVSLLFYKQF